MFKQVSAILLILFSLCFFDAKASHIVGGEVTYKYLSDSFVASKLYHKYQVSVIIYEDCQNGQPQAIAEDNPAFIGVFEVAPTGNFPLVRADSVFFVSSVSVPANFTNACVSHVPAVCLLKKTFVINYALPALDPGGQPASYVIDYQRCCRNGAVVNIQDPADNGSTYFCYIPPHPITNNSAVFKNYPPQIICLNNPLVYDHSATDADGDSLSYGFAPGLRGASSSNIKPFPPASPPFDTVSYMPGFNSQHPVPGSPTIQIDPITGLITGTPSRIGRYLVTVYCNEYRDGILINTTTREFQFVVTDCSKVVVADIPQFSTDFNTFEVNCENFTINFVNSSSGGFSYHWDFGVNGATSTEFQPSFTYPDTGTFTVRLLVNPGSTCPDSISRFVKVYPKFHAAFIDSGGQCPQAPVFFVDQSSATIKPINFWKWDFGDGDSSFTQNPVHAYQFGGAYNVVLISRNIKSCADTSVKHIFIDNFFPFAGNDTIIVKDEKIQFNAFGGTQYQWSPPDFLDNPNVYNPTGAFPDTGHFTYIVHVVSPYGCAGYDTIKITVVNQAAFQVPNAFTPNGDGLNDIFRPYAIGYRDLNYFRVFNRWGQEVYFSTNLETGWDGTYKKKQADIGTYFWEISFTDRFGQRGFMKGDVELIR